MSKLDRTPSKTNPHTWIGSCAPVGPKKESSSLQGAIIKNAFDLINNKSGNEGNNDNNNSCQNKFKKKLLNISLYITMMLSIGLLADLPATDLNGCRWPSLWLMMKQQVIILASVLPSAATMQWWDHILLMTMTIPVDLLMWLRALALDECRWESLWELTMKVKLITNGKQWQFWEESCQWIQSNFFSHYHLGWHIAFGNCAITFLCTNDNNPHLQQLKHNPNKVIIAKQTNHNALHPLVSISSVWLLHCCMGVAGCIC